MEASETFLLAMPRIPLALSVFFLLFRRGDYSCSSTFFFGILPHRSELLKGFGLNSEFLPAVPNYMSYLVRHRHLRLCFELVLMYVTIRTKSRVRFKITYVFTSTLQPLTKRPLHRAEYIRRQHVRIYLRRTHVVMTQYFLYRLRGNAFLDQQHRVRVAQAVQPDGRDTG